MLPEEPERSFIQYNGYPRCVFEVINTDTLSDEEELRLKQESVYATVMVHDYHLLMILVNHDIAVDPAEDDFHDILQATMLKASDFVIQETLKHV